jgi:hypothetical protein
MVHMSRERFQPVRNPDPIPAATLEDVKAVLDGLQPGAYLSADLYAKYVALMANQERQPASPQGFGRMLTEFGLIRRKVRGAHGWLVQ